MHPHAQHDPALEAALQASLAEQRRQPHPSATDARMRAAIVESLEVRISVLCIPSSFQRPRDALHCLHA